MQKSKILGKKIVSILIAVSMIASTTAMSIGTVFAGDTWPLEGDSAINANHPKMIGQRVYDLEYWEPDSEPYADLMRATVPLQKRNEFFSPTQANPELTSEAEVFVMGGDYGNSFFEGTPYNNEFSSYLYNFWQYTDYYASWHGVTTKGAPISQYEPDGPWQQRYFEFGLINMPNPAYTNAAHKNGSLSIGCIFLPRAGQTHASMIKKDENGEFPIAKKLIEFANYYGFDGYFINQEESIPETDVPIYKEFTKYLIENGMWIQWYDSILPNGNLQYQNRLNANNSTFIQDDAYGLGKVNNSLFVNYDWFRKNRIDTSLEHAEERGINLFEEVFFGVEANQNKLSGGHGSGQIEKLYAPGTKNLRGSLALFTPSDFIQNSLDEDITGGNAPNKRGTDEYQWMIMERERMYYSGVAQDPTNTGRMKGYENPTIGVGKADGWAGTADFTRERSVVNGTTFYSNFNTGHGMQYFVDGNVSNEDEWSNMNLQDILPTWQWWIDTPEKTKLKHNVVSEDDKSDTTLDTEVATPPADTVKAGSNAKSNVVAGLSTKVATEYSITIASTANGKVTADKATATQGTRVNLTVTPNTGYYLVENSLKMNGTALAENSFTMPNANAEITAEFISTPYEKLKADFDYGDKYYTGATKFEKVGAYNGGSSLVLTGDLEARNTVRLFKTDLDVTEDSKVDITYFKPSATDGTKLSLGIILEDTPDAMEVISIPGTGMKTNKWTTKTIDLSNYAGEDIATIALVVEPTQGVVDNYQINIGEIKVSDNDNYVPEKPTGFKITKAFDTDDMIVKWDMASYDEVKQYNIYANLSDGTRRFMGGTYGDTYYIKSTYGEDEIVTLDLVAVGADGSESEAATASYNYAEKVSNIAVEEETTANGNKLQSKNAGYLNVSWKNPSVDYEELEITVTPVKWHDYKERNEIYTKTVAKGVKSTTIQTPIADGSEYNLSIVVVNKDGTKGEPINYTGYFKDVYIEPYSQGYTIKDNKITFEVPKSEDWWHMYAYADGQPLTFRSEYDTDKQFAIRGKSFIHNVPLPNNFSGTIEVIMEDYSGNRSEPAYLPCFADETAEITSKMFTDPVVFAKVKELAKNVSELAAITSLDLSNTDVTDLYGISLLSNLESLNLTNCNKLTRVDSISGNVKLSELNITGCTNLQVMDIAGSSIEKIVYNKTSDFSKLVSMDISGSKFDLSEGTPEKILVDAITAQSEGKENVSFVNRQPSNLIKGVDDLNSYVSKGTKPATYPDKSDKGVEKAFDGDTNTYFHIANFDGGGGVANYSKPSELEFELKNPIDVVGYTIRSHSGAGRGFAEFEMYYSTDGVNYKLLGDEVKDNTLELYEKFVEEIPNVKYFKFIGRKGVQYLNLYMAEIELLGYDSTTYQTGVVSENQRPKAYSVYPENLDIKVGADIVDIRSLLDIKTVRGNNFALLQGADFIADDYSIVEQIFDPAILVTVTDVNGNVNVNTIDLTKAATYTVEFRTFKDIAVNGKVLGTTTVIVGDGGIIVPVVKSVVVTPKTATVRYGKTQQFTANVVADGNAPKTVAWTVTGGDKNSGTKIDANGLLAVGAKETSTELKVTAASTLDPTKKDVAIVTVTPYKAPSGGGSSTGGSSGGGSSTPAPSAPIVVEKNNKTEVTVKEPETTIVGNKAEVTIPTIDISNATASKPIDVTVNVPSDKVVDLIKNNTGSQVIIDVVIPSALFNTANVSVKDINVDKAIFKQAKESGKQVVLNIKDSNGKAIAEWTFDGKNVTNVLDTNLSLTVKSSNSLPSISKTFGSNAIAAVVSFNHDGLLPGTASVKLDVSKNFNSGDTLSLYYNNTSTGKLEKVSDGIVVDANGKATVKISHCSDYVLVKTASASAKVPTVVAPSTNPQTGDSWWRCLFA